MAKPSPSLALTLESIGKEQTPLIDLRSATEFVAAHPPGASSIPFEQLDRAWHELPPKGAQLDLLMNRHQSKSVQAIFEQQSYPIRKLLLAEEAEQSQWQADNLSQRLWRANPLLENHIDLIKQALDWEDGKKPLAFDIGCGSGRDSLFLALHGFEVLALDNNKHALERLRQFDQRWQTGVKSLKFDLQNQAADFQKLLRKQAPQLIMQARYLHRPLLADYRNLLPSGTVVAIHTFLEAAARYGKPKNPNYLLKNQELEKFYASWNILLNQQHRLEDGRPLSLFLAQKR